MILLALGVALWIAAHVFKRVLPGLRAKMGKAGRALMSLAIITSIVLMVIGYRATSGTSLYDPIDDMGLVNNLLMLLSIFLFGVGTSNGRLAAVIRHPMLWGMVVWSLAHLLVNGTPESLLLFGGLGLWAFAQMILVTRAEGPWLRPDPGLWGRDGRNFLIALVLYALISVAHIWLGYSPFRGIFG